MTTPIVQSKYSTIDLSHFNIQKKVLTTSRSKISTQAPLNKASLSGNQVEETTLGNKNINISIANSRASNAVPSFINFEQPEYPKIARARGIEGKVRIKVLFNQHGSVSTVEILESSSHPILDEAVKKSAQKWTIANSENSVFEKTFVFKLNN